MTKTNKTLTPLFITTAVLFLIAAGSFILAIIFSVVRQGLHEAAYMALSAMADSFLIVAALSIMTAVISGVLDLINERAADK